MKLDGNVTGINDLVALSRVHPNFVASSDGGDESS